MYKRQVEGGRFIAFGERGVIEDRIDEVIDLAAEGQHGLPDVHQFAGAVADDVDAQQLPRLAVEQQLEQAGCIADNLAAGDFAVARFANLVLHAVAGQLLLLSLIHI